MTDLQFELIASCLKQSNLLQLRPQHLKPHVKFNITKCRNQVVRSRIYSQTSGSVPHYIRTQLIRILFIRTLDIGIANQPDLLGPSDKFVENSTELTNLQITGNLIQYSTVQYRSQVFICYEIKIYRMIHMKSVPTQKRERMVVDPVNQYQKL